MVENAANVGGVPDKKQKLSNDAIVAASLLTQLRNSYVAQKECPTFILTSTDRVVLSPEERLKCLKSLKSLLLNWIHGMY